MRPKFFLKIRKIRAAAKFQARLRSCAAQEFLESIAKVLVEHSVNGRIHPAVQISKPHKYSKREVDAARLAVCVDHVRLKKLVLRVSDILELLPALLLNWQMRKLGGWWT